MRHWKKRWDDLQAEYQTLAQGEEDPPSFNEWLLLRLEKAEAKLAEKERSRGTGVPGVG